jgi:hypothetical protein
MQSLVSAVRELTFYSEGALFFLGLLAFIVVFMLFYAISNTITVWVEHAKTLRKTKEITEQLALLEKSLAQSRTHLDQQKIHQTNQEFSAIEHEKADDFDRALR